MAAPTQRSPRLPAEIRRRELLDAALDLIYEQGFGAVSVESIARRAGVTRPVVYDHFGDLDGLLMALIEREEQAALAPLLAQMDKAPREPANPDEVLVDEPADPDEVLVEGVRTFLHAVRANPRTWRLVLMPSRGGSPVLRERIARSRRRLASRLTDLLDWGIARRGGPAGLDRALAARLIVAAGEDAARLTLRHPRRYSPDRLAAITREILRLFPAAARPHGATPPPRSALLALPVRAPHRPDAPPARMSRAERREQLLDVALDLLAEEGFDSLTMEAIARRAGVNRAVVYRSFPNLKLLLLALLHREDMRTRETLDALLPTDPGSRSAARLLGEALTTFLDGVLRSPQTYRLVLQRPESAPLFLQKIVGRRRALVAERLEPLVEWGLGGLGVPAERRDVDLIARLLLSMGEEIARLALDDPEFPPDRVLAGAWTLLDMLPAPTARRRSRRRPPG
jgi:AcrR family transcriptional regulator